MVSLIRNVVNDCVWDWSPREVGRSWTCSGIPKAESCLQREMLTECPKHWQILLLRLGNLVAKRVFTRGRDRRPGGRRRLYGEALTVRFGAGGQNAIENYGSV